MPSQIVLAFLFLLLKYGMLTACDDSENGEFLPCQKAYVHCDQIDFLEGLIFIKIENGVVCTSAIYTDELGYYFKDYRGNKDCKEPEWQCERCGLCNPYWNTLCKKCHRVNWQNSG